MDLRNAILKGLSTLAGPAGAPIEAYLQAQNEIEASFNHNELLDKLISNEETTLVSLSEIFELRDELKESNSQLLIGIKTLQKLLSEKISSDDKIDSSTMEEIILENNQIFNLEGFITQEMIQDHLLDYYKYDIQKFIRIITYAGFDIGSLPQKVAPSEIIFTFLNELKGKDYSKGYRIIKKLSDDKPSDKVLLKLTSIYKELISV